MTTKEKIVAIIKKTGKATMADVISQFLFSRQYLNRLVKELIESGQLVKLGETRSTMYALPEYVEKHPEVLPTRYKKTFQNRSLEEHVILAEIEQELAAIKKIPENTRSIFTYAFSEMLNNAIEHSGSKTIQVEVMIQNGVLSFLIEDFGVGVFRNIQQKRKLHSELEAIQDLLKGKTTTMPKSHSGEGIFFTSKVGDFFSLDSFGHQLDVDNTLPDIFVKTGKGHKRGTKVTFRINIKSKLHLNDIFNRYTNLGAESDYGFDKTEIHVKLYTVAGVHISRSQARRALAGLEKFKIILFDFDKVPTVGQAFADEIFRVFQNKYPHIRLETANMNEGVQFMVQRAINEAKSRN